MEKKNSAKNEGAGKGIRNSCLQRLHHAGSALFNSYSWLSWKDNWFSVFGDRTFKDVIMVKRGQMVGPNPT